MSGVSPSRMRSMLAATFRRYDANGDGTIGGAEKAAAKRAIGKGR